MLNFIRLREASVYATPFPYLTATNLIESENLSRISSSFPIITKPGIFPLSELQYGQAFADLITAIKSQELEEILEDKFDMDLSDKPLMMTVRGHCQKKDGRIHSDSEDKILTCLLYLNDQSWHFEGGRLRLLHNQQNLDNMIAEVPPDGGNFVAFKRTENSWHGHAPFEGPRRYIMFNWLRSEYALAKNLGRHKLSAVLKRWGTFHDY